MSNLSFLQKRLLESVLWMDSGWVLDFSNRVFRECVQDATGIDIYSEKYSINGDSKAKRLRALWTIEPDEVVAKILLSLGKYSWFKELYQVTGELLGTPIDTDESIETIPIPKIHIKQLGLYPELEASIKQRLIEIEWCIRNNCFLASVLLCWSTLEWILLNYATRNSTACMNSAFAPKLKNGATNKDFSTWRLSELIDVIYDIGVFDSNIKKFSHALRGFRNYIHPYQQASEKFNPDKHTAEISYKILMLAIDQISQTNK